MKTMAQRVSEIEDEFDEPFWDVVRGFAEMGYSRRATARAIGYNERSFCEIVRSRTDIPWVPIGEAISRGLTPISPEHRRKLHEGIRRRARRYHVLWEWRSVAEISGISGMSKDGIRKRVDKGVAGDGLADPPMPIGRRGRVGALITNSKRGRGPARRRA